jgi:hypothetical protein
METPEKDLEPHFRFLSERLKKEIYEGYSNYVFTTTATILLVLGWLLTSKDARSYIAGYPAVKSVMTVAIIVFIAAEIAFSAGAVGTSHATKRLIERALKHAPDEKRLIEPGYYTPIIVPRHGVNIFVAVHVALYGVLIIVVWSISPAKQL